MIKKMLVALSLLCCNLNAYVELLLTLHQETVNNLNTIVFFDKKGTMYNYYHLLDGDITDPLVADPKYSDLDYALPSNMKLEQLDKDIELICLGIDPTGWLEYRTTHLYQDQFGRKYAVRESWYNDGTMDMILYDKNEKTDRYLLKEHPSKQ